MRWMFLTRFAQHGWLVVNSPTTSLTPRPFAHSTPSAAVTVRVPRVTSEWPASSASASVVGASSSQHTVASWPGTGVGTPPTMSKVTPVGLSGWKSFWPNTFDT